MAEILIVGLSARALAQSARRAGYVPLAADFFCDLDTRGASANCSLVQGNFEKGFEEEPLLGALERLAKSRDPIGIVCGTGFEDRPELLHRVGDRWALFGNKAGPVESVKDPRRLAALCKQLCIPHPGTAEAPADKDWLRKTAGGSGGGHIVRDATAETVEGSYWQERVEGDAVAALVLGSGSEAVVLGFSAQWCDPAPGAPYRYGGAVQPAALSEDMQEELGAAACALAEAAGLVGLNSVDFLLDGDEWHLLEVNPRPGATLDLFDPPDAKLFGLHVEACRGNLPRRIPEFTGAAAARVVYARHAVARVPEYEWPQWTADRQPPGTSLSVGAPVCTVLAEADTPTEARRLVEERGALVLAALGVA